MRSLFGELRGAIAVWEVEGVRSLFGKLEGVRSLFRRVRRCDRSPIWVIS